MRRSPSRAGDQALLEGIELVFEVLCSSGRGVEVGGELTVALLDLADSVGELDGVAMGPAGC